MTYLRLGTQRTSIIFHGWTATLKLGKLEIDLGNTLFACLI